MRDLDSLRGWLRLEERWEEEDRGLKGGSGAKGVDGRGRMGREGCRRVS